MSYLSSYKDIQHTRAPVAIRPFRNVGVPTSPQPHVFNPQQPFLHTLPHGHVPHVLKRDVPSQIVARCIHIMSHPSVF